MTDEELAQQCFELQEKIIPVIQDVNPIIVFNCLGTMFNCILASLHEEDKKPALLAMVRKMQEAVWPMGEKEGKH